MDIQEQHRAGVRTKRRITSNHRTGDSVVQRNGKQQWTDAAGLPLLPDEQPIRTVRHILYDPIPLWSREEKLIGTAPFLRLQKGKQLGFLFRFWPGAMH